MSSSATIILYLAMAAWSMLCVLMAQSQAVYSLDSPHVRTKSSGWVMAAGFIAAGPPWTFWSAFHYQTGTDTPIYVGRFYQFATIKTLDEFFAYSEEMEPDFVLLNKLVAFLGGPERLLVGLMVVITFAALSKGLLSFAGEISLRLAFYIVFMQFIPHSLNIMRQMAVAFLVLCAFRSMLERRFASFLLWIALAALFHSSALIVLPFYFAAGSERRHRVWFWGLAAEFTLFYIVYVFSLTACRAIL